MGKEVDRTFAMHGDLKIIMEQIRNILIIISMALAVGMAIVAVLIIASNM